MTGTDLDKLADPALVELVRERGQAPVSVLIEPDLPQPKVRVAPRDGRPGVARLTDIEPPDAAAAADAEARMERTRALLSDLLGRNPVWLRAARVFVAEVDGACLERVIHSPLVRSVYPNRKLTR